MQKLLRLSSLLLPLLLKVLILHDAGKISEAAAESLLLDPAEAAELAKSREVPRMKDSIVGLFSRYKHIIVSGDSTSRSMFNALAAFSLSAIEASTKPALPWAEDLRDFTALASANATVRAEALSRTMTQGCVYGKMAWANPDWNPARLGTHCAYAEQQFQDAFKGASPAVVAKGEPFQDPTVLHCGATPWMEDPQILINAMPRYRRLGGPSGGAGKLNGKCYHSDPTRELPSRSRSGAVRCCCLTESCPQHPDCHIVREMKQKHPGHATPQHPSPQHDHRGTLIVANARCLHLLQLYPSLKFEPNAVEILPKFHSVLVANTEALLDYLATLQGGGTLVYRTTSHLCEGQYHGAYRQIVANRRSQNRGTTLRECDRYVHEALQTHALNCINTSLTSYGAAYLAGVEQRALAAVSADMSRWAGKNVTLRILDAQALTTPNCAFSGDGRHYIKLDLIYWSAIAKGLLGV